MPAPGTGRTPHAECGRGGDTAQAGLTGHAHAGRARRRDVHRVLGHPRHLRRGLPLRRRHLPCRLPRGPAAAPPAAPPPPASGGCRRVRGRAQDGRHVAGPILDATVATAIFSALGGLVVGDLGPFPGWSSVGWLVLLALRAQTAGGLLIAIALPRLPAVTTSLLLLSQPVASIFLAMIIVAEPPPPLQLLGVVLVG